MIRLRSAFSSNDTPVDLHSVHDRLAASFRACGYRNLWLVDDHIIALSTWLQHSDSVDVSDSRVRETLIRVLLENGFEDVARHFRNAGDNSSQAALRRRLEAKLRDCGIRASEEQLEKLLLKLGLLEYNPEDLSDTFLREICLLEFPRCEPLPPPVVEPQSRPFAAGLFAGAAGDWDESFLRFRAGGFLFNSVRIEIDPLALADSLAMGEFMEMIFFGHWNRLLEAAAARLEQLFEGKDCELPDYLTIVNRNCEKLASRYKLSRTEDLFSDLEKSEQKYFGKLLKGRSGMLIKGLE